MAKKTAGLHEERTRVTCNLPLENQEHEKAVNKVIKYLENLRTRPDGVKGFTHSALRPAAFKGYWWSSGRRSWADEKIVMFIVDYKLGLGDERTSKLVAELKNTISVAYTQCTGVPQEEVWVVAQQVFRYD